MDGQDTPLDGYFPYRLAVAAERFSQALSEVYGAEYGLTREEWRLLFLLAGEPTVTSLELARRTTLDKVQVSRASQRLADKGLITKAADAGDRRLRVYACTSAGRQMFQEALPQVQARAAGVLGSLSEGDAAALDRGIKALIAALGSQDEQA